MVRTHPQWLRARELVRSGEVGELRSMFPRQLLQPGPPNIRNQPEIGGGALMDIGCYSVQISRFLFEAEPVRCVGAVERDPEMGTDRLTSGLLEFRGGHSVFTCSTQLVPYQTVQILCTKGRIEIEIPFNAPPDRPCRIYIDDGRDLFGRVAGLRSFRSLTSTRSGRLFSAASSMAVRCRLRSRIRWRIWR